MHEVPTPKTNSKHYQPPLAGPGICSCSLLFNPQVIIQTVRGEDSNVHMICSQNTLPVANPKRDNCPGFSPKTNHILCRKVQGAIVAFLTGLDPADACKAYMHARTQWSRLSENLAPQEVLRHLTQTLRRCLVGFLLGPSLQALSWLIFFGGGMPRLETSNQV